MDNVVKFYQPVIFQNLDFLLGGESTRHGGVSPKPYQSLNLGLNTNDNYKNVTENRKRLFSRLNILEEQTSEAHQIHGNEVLNVHDTGFYKGYDALITQQKKLYLLITIADCVPVLIYDHKQMVIGAVHAGWRGTVKQIVEKTLGEMSRQYGTYTKDCYAYVGTCIDEQSFEVGEDVAQYFLPDHKRWDVSKEKYYVDLKAANKYQLLNCGLPEEQIEISPYSTVLHNQDYFSYRKEKGETGRMLAIIGFRW